MALSGLLAMTGCVGDPGEKGANGATGDAGAAGAAGLKGDPGAKGDPGTNGEAGTAGAKGDPGTAGAKGDQGVPGEKGEPGAAGAKGDQGLPGAKGEPGTPALDPNNFVIALDPTGLVGRILDTAKTPVAGAQVFLVPATAINKDKLVVDNVAPKNLAMDVVVADKADEPLEDLIDAQLALPAPTYPVATTDAAGVYDIKAVAAGSYYVFVLPAKTDTARLPGGSNSRVAKDAVTLLTGKRLDGTLSMAIPAGATYVGTTTCTYCHGKLGVKSTLHFMGIHKAGKNDGLQKLNVLLWPNFDAPAAYFDGQTTIYYYSKNPTAVPPSYSTYLVKAGEPQPDATWLGANTPSFKISLIKNAAGESAATIENLKATEPTQTYAVQLVYGGGLFKQRYVVEIKGQRHILPIQVNATGLHDNTAATPSDRRHVIGYNTDRWYNEGTKLLATPSNGKSFEAYCIGCHAVGVNVVPGKVAGTYDAWSIPDVWAGFDFDKDGTNDQQNVGCETCHGPGSAHVSKQGGGWNIVTPQNLPPERESMLCGQCHSRVNGVGAGKTEAPLDAKGNMMIAGTRRADWLKNNVSVLDDGVWTGTPAADGTFTAIGDGKHSIKHHQQYSDFIKSSHYRNGKQLVTCTDCHNVHGTKNTSQTKADPTTVDTCKNCHADQATNLDNHVKVKTNMPAAMGAVCVDCHMTKTALSGAGIPGVKGFWENDISSHFFDVPKKALIKGIDPAAAKGPLGKVMPIPYTNSCALTCHTFPVQ